MLPRSVQPSTPGKRPPEPEPSYESSSPIPGPLQGATMGLLSTHRSLTPWPVSQQPPFLRGTGRGSRTGPFSGGGSAPGWHLPPRPTCSWTPRASAAWPPPPATHSQGLLPPSCPESPLPEQRAQSWPGQPRAQGSQSNPFVSPPTAKEKDGGQRKQGRPLLPRASRGVKASVCGCGLGETWTLCLEWGL